MSDLSLRAWLAGVLRQGALALAAALWLLAPSAVLAQAGEPGLERQVKAAFLYRFIDYVRWPQSVFAQPDSPITIGVLGDPTMVAELQNAVAGRSVRGHPIVVRVAKEGEWAGLQVLFLSESVNPRLRRIIRSVEGPVLIVTEAEDGLASGSVINFVIAERRVRFEVALAPAQARSLAIASGLLSVAINVRKDSFLWDWPRFSLSYYAAPTR